ncbi:molybdopterin-dependent oxidoreductase, partial [Klebsiella pneumoniae]|uniref:molybdopterin-dependent oxidoreductase n=1 Tax=Klebsiella pneumoniae TaxID=573 RepID=UPI003136720C
VHEQYWTAQAKFSDIVLPATTSLEREDIGSGGQDGVMIAMSAQIPPGGGGGGDYAIFCDLAGRVGFGEAFSEGGGAGEGPLLRPPPVREGGAGRRFSRIMRRKRKQGPRGGGVYRGGGGFGARHRPFSLPAARAGAPSNNPATAI